MSNYVDSHAHVTSARMVSDFKNVKKRAMEAGVGHILIMCTTLKEADKAITIAKEDLMFSVAVGFHPNDLDKINEEDYAKLEELLQEPNVVALGEIGMDYHWDTVDKQVQEQGFRRQIEMARKYDLPISIHMREATKDTLDILKDYAPIKGVMHCYSGSVETMREVVKLGLYISFAGPLTFKNSRELPQVAKEVPMDRILSETDSPYLTPHPFRGQPNEPMYVPYVVEKIAEVREMSIEDVKQQIERNYHALFLQTKKG